jgi:hypothetical protein
VSKWSNKFTLYDITHKLNLPPILQNEAVNPFGINESFPFRALLMAEIGKKTKGRRYVNENKRDICLLGSAGCPTGQTVRFGAERVASTRARSAPLPGMARSRKDARLENRMLHDTAGVDRAAFTPS